MRRTRALGATATLLAVLAASGCGGSSDGGSSTSAPAATHTTKPGIASGEPAPPAGTTSSTATKSSSTKAKPTAKSTAAGAPGVPEAARQHTKAGAKAFARNYIILVNETAMRPKVGVLEPLALKTCKTCDNHEKTVRALVRDNQRFTKREMTILRTSVIADSSVGTFVELHGYEPKIDIVDASGKVVQSFPEVKDQGLVFNLKWTRNGWRVVKLQTTD